jgi:hypothetical protein
MAFAPFVGFSYVGSVAARPIGVADGRSGSAPGSPNRGSRGDVPRARRCRGTLSASRPVSGRQMPSAGQDRSLRYEVVATGGGPHRQRRVGASGGATRVPGCR